MWHKTSYLADKTIIVNHPWGFILTEFFPFLSSGVIVIWLIRNTAVIIQNLPSYLPTLCSCYILQNCINPLLLWQTEVIHRNRFTSHQRVKTTKPRQVNLQFYDFLQHLSSQSHFWITLKRQEVKFRKAKFAAVCFRNRQRTKQKHRNYGNIFCVTQCQV